MRAERRRIPTSARADSPIEGMLLPAKLAGAGNLTLLQACVLFVCASPLLKEKAASCVMLDVCGGLMDLRSSRWRFGLTHDEDLENQMPSSFRRPLGEGSTRADI